MERKLIIFLSTGFIKKSSPQILPNICASADKPLARWWWEELIITHLLFCFYQSLIKLFSYHEAFLVIFINIYYMGFVTMRFRLKSRTLLPNKFCHKESYSTLHFQDSLTKNKVFWVFHLSLSSAAFYRRLWYWI